MKTIQIQKSTATKEKICKEAFKLFISKPYEQVTINELETAIGKTRGALFYHIKDKRDLFAKVFDKYFINNQNIYTVVGENILESGMTLLEFIDIYITAQEKRINDLYVIAEMDESQIAERGISKIESTYLALQLNAGFYLEDYDQKMDMNFKMDRNTWSFFITKAIENGEIKPNTNAKLFGNIFSF